MKRGKRRHHGAAVQHTYMGFRAGKEKVKKREL